MDTQQNQQDSEQKYESEHVWDVYEAIHPHFSNTRYKPWPKIEEFLNGLPPGSVVGDIGCGNGKYMHIPESNSSCSIGVDRCQGLGSICRERGFSICIADGIRLPFRTSCFDAVISVAVIHHFVSEERRLLALQELFRILRVGGTLFLSVWALEQKRFEGVNSQDTLVPWHFRSPSNKERDEKVFHRYYHLFREGETENLFFSTNNCNLQHCAYDHENYYAIAVKT